MSFLTKSTGATVTRTAEHVTDNVDDPLPKNTRVTCGVDDVQWRAPSDAEIAEGDDQDVINVQWRVQGGPFDNRVLFQKLRVLSNDVKKRDNALDFYAATDTILNEGFLLELGEEPLDEELMAGWMGKTADLVLGVWNKKEGNVRVPGGNYVTAIYPANSGGRLVEGAAAEGGRRRRAPADAPASAGAQAATSAAAAPARRRRGA